MSWPGMQKPHWTAPVSRNACWSGCRRRRRRESLDGRDGGAVGLDREHQARVHALAIEQDGARAALPDEAAFLGPGQAKVVPKDVEQRVVRARRRSPVRDR